MAGNLRVNYPNAYTVAPSPTATQTPTATAAILGASPNPLNNMGRLGNIRVPEQTQTQSSSLPSVATPPPNIDQAELAAENADDMLRRRRGRASTILSGPDGAMPESTNVATKILLGM